MFKTVTKRWIVSLGTIFATSAMAFAGVTVSSPAPGSTSGSPVHFVASSPSAIAMTVYVDNAAVYSVKAATLNTSIPLAAGQHYVVVQAWDAAGAVTKFPETIIVGAANNTANGVAISSPANNATVNGPIPVVASAGVPGRSITALAVYLDNNLVFKINGASVNTKVNAGPGTHQLVVQAWDSANAIYKNSVMVTAGGTTATMAASAATAPSAAATHAAIQTMPGWESCDACAGIGAHGPRASYSMVENQASPSLSGRSARFNVGGSTPYADAIWWKQLGADNAKTHFQYDLDFYLTAPQFAQSLEFDANQSTLGKKFIFGTQCNIKGDGQWDVWDTAGNTWRPTGIACAMPAAYQWHHLTWQFYRDSSKIYFVSFTLDGVTHYVNRSYNAKPVNAAEVNVAFQMDGDYAMHSYSAWLDNVTLRAW